ncbi:MAG TPA: FUSC family membrane protein, partial [Polyangia bacterium]
MASDPASPPHPVRQLVRIAPGRPALMLGVRAALATAVPLLCAPLVGPVAATWASTGGFTVALADKGGSYRTRAATMGGVTLAAACAVVAGALAAPHVWAAAPLMLVVASACGFAGVLGAAAAGGAVTVAVLFAVSLALPPASATAALERGLAIVAAGAWAMTLALLFWPVRVYKPARYAVARSYRALAAHARRMAELSVGSDAWSAEVTRGHGAIRVAIEQARDVLAATRRGRLGESGRGARLLVCLQVAEQLFGALVALEEVLDASPARAPAAHALAGLATALELAAARVVPEGRLPPAPPLPFDGAEVRAAGDEHAALLVERTRAYVALALETIATLHAE